MIPDEIDMSVGEFWYYGLYFDPISHLSNASPGDNIASLIHQYAKDNGKIRMIALHQIQPKNNPGIH